MEYLAVWKGSLPAGKISLPFHSADGMIFSGKTGSPEMERDDEQ